MTDFTINEVYPPQYIKLRFWEQGLDVAQRWYHEEWDGSYIQLDLARDIAKEIEKQVLKVENAHNL